MTVHWTPTALRDLASLHTYVGRDNPTAADEAVERILAGVTALPQHSDMGRIGRLATTRELLLSPFVIAYRQRRGALEVLAIIHGARRWADRL